MARHNGRQVSLGGVVGQGGACHDKDTERLFQRQFLRHFPPELHRLAWRKLVQLDAAERLDDLRIPPANRLEHLSGDRAGQYSIRITISGECASAGRTGMPTMSK